MADPALLGAQCVLCGRINTCRSNHEAANYVLPFPIYCLIVTPAAAAPTLGAFQVTMCSACYRRLHTWIIFTKKSYPTVDRDTIPNMFEQMSVEFQMAAMDNVPQAAAPNAVKLRRSKSPHPAGCCSECGARPRPTPFASQLSEALLPEMLRAPDPDSVLAALPGGLRDTILSTAYSPRPFESRMFPLVVDSDPVLIEMVDVLLCGGCYRRSIMGSRFPLAK